VNLLSLGACLVSLQGGDLCPFDFHRFIYDITDLCQCTASCHDALLVFVAEVSFNK
jgi:hypothetical protein